MLKRLFILKLLIIIILFHSTDLFALSFNEIENKAELGDPKAQFILGFYYYSGEYSGLPTIDINYEEALKWITLSAENGYSYAQFHLGGMYFEGKGVEIDYSNAAKWFLISAKNGNVQARTNIAICYYQGKGVIQDYYQSYAWASLASYKKSENAKKIIQVLIPKLVDRNKADLLAGEYFVLYGEGDIVEK